MEHNSMDENDFCNMTESHFDSVLCLGKIHEHLHSIEGKIE